MCEGNFHDVFSQVRTVDCSPTGGRGLLNILAPEFWILQFLTTHNSQLSTIHYPLTTFSENRELTTFYSSSLRNCWISSTWRWDSSSS